MSVQAKEKRNVFLLFVAQALFQTAMVMVMLVSGLIGQELASNKNLATLPVTIIMIAAAITMIPASLFMQRWGRKAGFHVGLLMGALSGVLGALALWQQNFWLFVWANMFMGSYQGFAQFYRFAAADAASPAFKSRALSWVVAGGVVAAVLGPEIAIYTKDWHTTAYVASYASLLILALLGAFVVAALDIPPASKANHSEPARPLLAIVRQPLFLVALTSSAVGYAVMVMVMTATPLAMVAAGHPMAASASVIKWHVLGMFVPSFFTGSLIQRLGVLPVLVAGVAMLLVQVLLALMGHSLELYLAGLILLGVGWNFLFVGGSSLLTHTYRPSEQAKAQAFHDFLVFGVISLASLSAGALLHMWGWEVLNLVSLPLLLLVVAAVGFLLAKPLHRPSAP